MEPNLHEYPYTSYEDGCSMGCFMGMCHRAGVKLAVVGDSLQLLDRNNFVLSQVKVAIAQSALKDELGNDITAYIIGAGTREDTVVFSKGNGDEIVITVPYATEASKDSEGQDITSYLRNIVVSGDKLRVTKGDGSAFEITVPYATKAFTDVNDKPITTYAASMEVSGNNVILKDGLGTVISTITVHFAERAAADENGNNIRESYASVLQAGTTTVKLIAKSGDLLSEITVPYATSALKDTNGNEFLKDYAESLVVDNDGKRLDLLAHDGTLLSAVTVPFSTLATDATNAIERAEIVGDQLVLTTYGGVVTRLTIPYAVRALNDGESNEITKTYVHNVVQDPVTGEITFYDADGTALCALTPRARIAEYDTYNNLIADYIKTLVFDNQSDYLVATHGDGTADTIVVNYATKALKDTQGNIIKNTYIAFLANVVDNENEWVLVAYNGEGSELFRLKVVANKAQKDAAGNVITDFYVHSLTISGDTISYNNANDVAIGSITLPKYVKDFAFTNGWLQLFDIDGNLIKELKVPVEDLLGLTLDNSDQIALTDNYGQDLNANSRVHLPEYVKSGEISGSNLLLKDIHGNTLNTIALPGGGIKQLYVKKIHRSEYVGLTNISGQTNQIYMITPGFYIVYTDEGKVGSFYKNDLTAVNVNMSNINISTFYSGSSLPAFQATDFSATLTDWNLVFVRDLMTPPYSEGLVRSRLDKIKTTNTNKRMLLTITKGQSDNNIDSVTGIAQSLSDTAINTGTFFGIAIFSDIETEPIVGAGSPAIQLNFEHASGPYIKEASGLSTTDGGDILLTVVNADGTAFDLASAVVTLWYRDKTAIAPTSITPAVTISGSSISVTSTGKNSDKDIYQIATVAVTDTNGNTYYIDNPVGCFVPYKKYY